MQKSGQKGNADEGKKIVKKIAWLLALFILILWAGASQAKDCRLGADYYYRAGAATDLNQRIVWLQRSVKVCPSFNAWYMLGLIFKTRGQPQRAIDAFHHARAEAGSSRTEALALGRSGEVWLQTGHRIQALHALELAQRFHPMPAPGWLNNALRDARIQAHRTVVPAADIAFLLDAGMQYSRDGRFAVRPAVNLPVHFDFDQARLNSAGNRQVTELGRALTRAQMRPWSFVLVGHTDQRGSMMYNQILSERRALTVKRKLEKQFPSLKHRLETEGRGETQLLYDGTSETDHMLNRRVKVSLMN